MKKRIYTILLLFLFSAASFTMASDLPDFDALIGVSFSDKLVPGTEISWVLKEYQNEDPWEIVPGYEINEDDIFKLNITKDPDDLGITSPEGIFFWAESWCDFYLNDVFITENSTDINWRDWTMGADFMPFILPTTLEFNDSSEMSFFDYLYSAYTGEFPLPGYKLTAKITDETLTIQMEYTGKSKISIIGPSGYDYSAKFVINLEWGVIVLIDITVDYAIGKEKLVLETGIEDIEVPFEWLYGMFAFLIMGLVAYRRRR